MEYLQIFDNDKNMLDEKIARSDKHLLEDGKHYMVVLVFIENEEGKFLLQRTSESKGRVVATTGGHVVYGDNGLRTAIKEVKEELDLDIDENDLKYVDTFSWKNLFCELYYVKKNVDIDKLSLQEEEVESVMWLSKDEIEDLITKNDFRDSNIKPFEVICNMLNK